MFSRFFITRPKFAFAISILIILAGSLAIYNLPVSQYPEIVPPMVEVSTTYPGASAEIIEQTVIAPLEQEINGVEDMIYFSSQSSNDGTAKITIYFKVGTDPDINTINTQNRVSLAAAKLPESVVKQGIKVKEKSSQMLMIIGLYSDNPEFDSVFLNNHAYLNLKDPITRIPGVGEASLLSDMTYSMRIWLNPNKLATLGISINDVSSAINEQNTQVPAGQIGAAPTTKGQQYKYTVRTLGRLSSVREFENIIIRESENGASIKLKDIAKIELGAQNYSSRALLNNKPAALLALYQIPEANALDVANKVKEKLESMSKNFPEGIEAGIFYNSTDFIAASIREVVITLFIAVVLVILVTYIFLQDWRSTLVPAIAIPVSLIGTFAALLLLGYTINLITLFGLILAIGIVVDDAIVVIENVSRLIEEENLTPASATIKSMEQVTSPIIATTFVLLATFVPVAFLPGITGQLYRQFAVTVVIAVLISFVNALTLSPALCAVILKNEKKKPVLIFRLFNQFFSSLTEKYLKTVSCLIRKPALIITVLLLIFISIFYIYERLPASFIPNEDQGSFMITVQLPEGSSLERTVNVMDKTYSILKNIEGIKDVLSTEGFSIITETLTPNSGFFICTLDDWSIRTAPETQINAIIERVNLKVSYEIHEAEIHAFNLTPIPGLGTSGGFEFELQQKGANSPLLLASVMNELICKANEAPELTEVYSTYKINFPQIYIDIDREKAKKLGISLSALYDVLGTYLGSTYVNDFNKFGKVFKVMLQAESSFRDEKSDLYRLYVRNNKNQMVSIKTFTKITTKLGPQTITHYDMLPAASIQGSNAPPYSSGDAIKKMEELAKEILPDNMSYSWTGTAYQEIIAGNLAIFIFILAIIFIYLFLVAQYESWIISLAVILSIPIALIGALAALWITGISNNIYAQIGYVLLFGMASKTAILIVEFAKSQHENGKSILEAAEYAARIRFRSVIMTAVSFLIGVLPLVLASGPGAASRRSLGTPVFGGMIIAALIGTLLLPVFYVIVQNIIEFKLNRKSDREENED